VVTTGSSGTSGFIKAVLVTSGNFWFQWFFGTAGSAGTSGNKWCCRIMASSSLNYIM